MDLRWYWNRLRSMSAPELAHRVLEHRRKSQARKMTGGWSRFKASEGGSIPALAGLADSVDRAAPALADAVAASAADILAGRFEALGVEWPRFKIDGAKDSLWHLDPVSKRHWPSDVYCFDVAYRGSTTMGDVKYAWEFSRLQFLQPVALHARYTKDAEALAFVERAISSWHASNPPFVGVGWSSGIELSLRAITLLVVTTFIGDQLSPKTLEQIEEILRGHAFWLARYPSRFSSANNHLVSEDAALYLLGAACPFLDGADRMRSHAEHGLIREAQLQILSDGVAAEQSPTYGALTSECILLCAFVAAHRGTPMPDVVTQRLSSFADWIFWLAEADGTVPAIGDDDEGRVLTLGQHEATYATSVAATIAAFAGRSDIVPPHQFTLRNALAEQIQHATRPSGTRTFGIGGYTVHRGRSDDRDVTLVVDHAPLGYLAIAAHGHADALAFTMTVDGQPLFVDPGTYLYHSGHHWRDWFRNTRSHNTVSVENAEQSVISGAFNWSHKANTHLGRVQAEPFMLEAYHDGYEKRFGVQHFRRYTMDGGSLILHDALTGGPRRNVELILQLSPDCDATIEGNVAVIRRSDDSLARVTFPSSGRLTSSRGEDRVDGGWVSPHFGAKIPATRLSWSGEVGETIVETRIDLI